MPDKSNLNYSNLRALFFNATLNKSSKSSHTETLIKVSQKIMQKQGVKTEIIRPIDYDIATGVWPDMREHGWETTALK